MKDEELKVNHYILIMKPNSFIVCINFTITIFEL